MRGDAEFRPPVHVPRADLNFDRLAAGADHRGVQALVHVEFRHGDVVLEPTGNRIPPRMHGTERRIAVLDGVDDDAYADQIVDIREIVSAHDHLLVDGEIILRASCDGRLDVQVVEILIDFGDDLLEVDITLAGASGHKHDDLVVDLRVEHLEAQLFKLGFDGVHAQPIGERRVDVQRFTRLALRVRRLDVAPRPGVMHAVGELDDEYTHVTAHGDHHLADGLRLGGIAVLHLRKLGDTVHEPGDGISEFGSTLGERVIGVLDRVVEQPGGHHDRPHAQVRENLRDGQRVDDVRLTGFAPLRAMLDDRTTIRTLENAHVLVRMVRLAHAQNRLKRVKRIFTDLTAEHMRGLELLVLLAMAVLL